MGRTTYSEFVIERVIRVTGLSAIIFVVMIFLFLIQSGAPAFLEVPLGDLLTTRWYPIEDHYGLVPLILGSLLVTLGAAAIALPLGLATAIFIAEIAPNWAREILKPFVEVLAGIPSVVLGFFGMVMLAPVVRQLFGAPTGLTALTGSMLLALMSLPTIVSVAEDALDAVPKGYRNGALALGITQWQTIRWVIVPAARSGILTGMMLGIGRAIGETMAVMMVTGNAARVPTSPIDLLMPVRTMTATIAAEMGEVAQGSTHYSVLFAVGIVLFVISFAVNLTAATVVFGQIKRSERILS
jgi:phosphate transport system permease protein